LSLPIIFENLIIALQEQSAKFSNLQLVLLKIFSRNISDRQLLEIKGIISRYFADKASDEFERLAEERWTVETYRQWANEHNRAFSK
jgi:hypothetical protein